jgi:hypothetical protein
MKLLATPAMLGGRDAATSWKPPPNLSTKPRSDERTSIEDQTRVPLPRITERPNYQYCDNRQTHAQRCISGYTTSAAQLHHMKQQSSTNT